MIKYQTSLYSCHLLYAITTLHLLQFKSLFLIHTPTIWLINKLYSHWVKNPNYSEQKIKKCCIRQSKTKKTQLFYFGQKDSQRVVFESYCCGRHKILHQWTTRKAFHAESHSETWMLTERSESSGPARAEIIRLACFPPPLYRK